MQVHTDSHDAFEFDAEQVATRTASRPPGCAKAEVAKSLVGVDIGGTFTDCVVLDRAGRITATKASSTPRDFAEGMLAAMRVAAERLGLSFEQFCREVAVLTHGTTVGTNTLIQRKGARVGLITTRGHEDAIHIMRGSRGVSSRDIAKVVHFPSSQKPVAHRAQAPDRGRVGARRLLRRGGRAARTKPRPRPRSGASSRRASRRSRSASSGRSRIRGTSGA